MDNRTDRSSTTLGEATALAPAIGATGECTCGRFSEPSPDVIIDGRGLEVAVVVGYAHYIGLLGILATQLDRCLLPPYWRSAVDRCLIVGKSHCKPGDGAAADGFDVSGG